MIPVRAALSAVVLPAPAFARFAGGLDSVAGLRGSTRGSRRGVVGAGACVMALVRRRGGFSRTSRRRAAVPRHPAGGGTVVGGGAVPLGAGSMLAALPGTLAHRSGGAGRSAFTGGPGTMRSLAARSLGALPRMLLIRSLRKGRWRRHQRGGRQKDAG